MAKLATRLDRNPDGRQQSLQVAPLLSVVDAAGNYCAHAADCECHFLTHWLQNDVAGHLVFDVQQAHSYTMQPGACELMSNNEK
mmetsp:Transcript_5453/g.8986  ORF Transcript_5453/g.8986 Transcript_5453/m.8986 type:complete len:84 (-) Transcript_5453:145-396(-)